jgi:hypothetical protein
VAHTGTFRLGGRARGVAAVACVAAAATLLGAAPASATTLDPVAAGVPGNGRAWELVTPAEPVSARLTPAIWGITEEPLLGISPSGDRIAYKAAGALPDASFGSIISFNLAERGVDGWANRSLPVPRPETSNLVMTNFGLEGPGAFDTELTKAVWFNSLDGEGLEYAMAFGSPGPPYTPLTDLGHECVAKGASADLGRVFFYCTTHLTPADSGRTSGSSVYEFDGSGFHLLEERADGSLIGACGSMPEGASLDREEFFFSAKPGCGPTRHIYLRADGRSTDASASQCTLADCGPEAEPTYLGVSSNDSAVFFSSTQRLTDADNEGKPMVYRYDVASGTLSQLFQQPPGAAATSFGEYFHLLHSSADGSSAYFFAQGQLLPGDGSESGWNLYRADGSDLHFIAPDEDDVALVSADGRYAVFSTPASLGPADTDSSVDVYRYDADTGKSVLISAGGGGGSDATLPRTSKVLDDDRRVVFSTGEPLLPQDRNDEEDVYEWAEGGGLSLISAGAPGLAAKFAGVTPDAGTVFFLTAATLLPRDRDGGEFDIYAARIGGGQPEPPEPGTGACSGSGCGEGSAGSPSRPPVARPDRGPRLELGPIGAAARRQLARTGATTLLVEAPAAGRLTVVGRARGNRLLAAGSAPVESAGPLQVQLRLRPSARRALARGNRIPMRLFLALGHARTRGPAVTLKLSRGS